MNPKRVPRACRTTPNQAVSNHARLPCPEKLALYPAPDGMARQFTLTKGCSCASAVNHPSNQLYSAPSFADDQHIFTSVGAGDSTRVEQFQELCAVPTESFRNYSRDKSHPVCNNSLPRSLPSKGLPRRQSSEICLSQGL